MMKLGLKEAILGMSLVLGCAPNEKPTPTEEEVWSRRICDEQASVQRARMLSIIAALKPEKRGQFQELPDLVAKKAIKQCEDE